jgi:hypothetical protein
VKRKLAQEQLLARQAQAQQENVYALSYERSSASGAGYNGTELGGPGHPYPQSIFSASSADVSAGGAMPALYAAAPELAAEYPTMVYPQGMSGRPESSSFIPGSVSATTALAPTVVVKAQEAAEANATRESGEVEDAAGDGKVEEEEEEEEENQPILDERQMAYCTMDNVKILSQPDILKAELHEHQVRTTTPTRPLVWYTPRLPPAVGSCSTLTCVFNSLCVYVVFRLFADPRNQLDGAHVSEWYAYDIGRSGTVRHSDIFYLSF